MFLCEGHLVLAVRIILHDINKVYCNYWLVLCCLFVSFLTLICLQLQMLDVTVLLPNLQKWP
jgi:hypothetical protein